jgi:AraC family transcriptional regulator, transcriptional activator of pobA
MITNSDSTVKRKPINYRGLYGEEGNHSIDSFIYSEKIQTRSKSFSWEIKPHLHTNLFQFFFVEKNGGTLFYNEGEKRFNKGTVLIFPPNQTHGFLWDASVSGRILTVSDFFLENLFPDSSEMFYWLTSQKIILNSSPGILKEIIHMISEVDEELFARKKGRDMMLNFNLGRLLLFVYRSFCERDYEITLNEKRNVTHFINFQKLVKKFAYSEKSIPEYAYELNITPVHLNRICKSVCGKPALWIIQDNLIQNAKQLLMHTTYSISEVCFEMKINDPAYFTRLFKKHVGVSPNAFRNRTCK